MKYIVTAEVIDGTDSTIVKCEFDTDLPPGDKIQIPIMDKYRIISGKTPAYMAHAGADGDIITAVMCLGSGKNALTGKTDKYVQLFYNPDEYEYMIEQGEISKDTPVGVWRPEMQQWVYNMAALRGPMTKWHDMHKAFGSPL